MKNFKCIRSSLSLATLALIQNGCGSSDSNSTTPVIVLTPNISAPELVASWSSDCDGVITSTSVTSTGSSGGSATARGDFTLRSFEFDQDGSGTASEEEYDESTCTNTNLVVRSAAANFAYTIGNSTLDKNGMSATEINLNYNGSISHTMFKIENNDLFLADGTNSNSGNDGTSSTKRLNGFSNDGLDKQ